MLKKIIFAIAAMVLTGNVAAMNQDDLIKSTARDAGVTDVLATEFINSYREHVIALTASGKKIDQHTFGIYKPMVGYTKRVRSVGSGQMMEYTAYKLVTPVASVGFLELAHMIGGDIGVTDDQAKLMLGAMSSVIIGASKKGDTIDLRGFGRIYVGEQAPRNVRHPQTGEMIPVPAKKVVKFRAGEGVHLKFYASSYFSDAIN